MNKRGRQRYKCNSQGNNHNSRGSTKRLTWVACLFSLLLLLTLGCLTIWSVVPSIPSILSDLEPTAVVTAVFTVGLLGSLITRLLNYLRVIIVEYLHIFSDSEMDQLRQQLIETYVQKYAPTTAQELKEMLNQVDVIDLHRSERVERYRKADGREEKFWNKLVERFMQWLMQRGDGK